MPRDIFLGERELVNEPLASPAVQSTAQASPSSLTQSRLLSHEVNAWMQKGAGRVEGRILKGVKKTQILLTVWWTQEARPHITGDSPPWMPPVGPQAPTALCLTHTAFCRPKPRMHCQ